MADRDWVPMPSGVWDEQPCSALAEDGVDAVVALNMLRDRIPRLVRELEQVHQALPKMLVEVLTGDVSPVRWPALAALFDEPARIMAGLARVCRDQAAEKQQIEEGQMADDQEHGHEYTVQSRKNEHGQYEYRTVCECGDVQWDWHL